MATLKVLINGTPLTFSSIDTVTVIAEREDEHLHFTFTHEGLMTDLIDPALQDEGKEVFASQWTTFEEIATAP